MPNEIRLKPPSASSTRYFSSTDSGLASVVISASAESPNSPLIALSMATRSAAGSRVGVPPPKKTVSTGTYVSPSARRASRTSSIAVAG